MKNLPQSLILNENTQNMKLIIHGQCVFIFKVLNNPQEIIFTLSNSDNTNNIFIKFSNKKVAVYNSNLNETYIDNNNLSGLIDNDDAIYWFSLDSQNQILRAGIGEARPDTIIYDYKFSYTFEDEDYEKNKIYIESFTNLTYHENILPLKSLRDPIVSKVPLKVKNTNQLTMNDVAENKYLPHSNLSQTAQQLYECISGKKFILDDEDFPDFSKAIISKSSPKIAVWSYPIFVMIDTSGSIILTASSLPPKPTSKIITSRFFLLKIINAARVLNSKKVKVIFFLLSSINSNAWHISSVSAGILLILILSLHSIR